MDNTVVLCISADLPFAKRRFCGAEAWDNVINLSPHQMAPVAIPQNYGVAIEKWSPLAGGYGTCVVVLDENDTVCTAKLVGDIKDEPNYDQAWLFLSEQNPFLSQRR